MVASRSLGVHQFFAPVVPPLAHLRLELKSGCLYVFRISDLGARSIVNRSAEKEEGRFEIAGKVGGKTVAPIPPYESRRSDNFFFLPHCSSAAELFRCR